MMFHLIAIPSEDIRDFWKLAGPMLERAIALTDGATSTEREVERAICGETVLWGVVEEDGPKKTLKAVGITSVQLNADGSKTANIEQFSGEDMRLWFDLKHEFEAWALAEGCKDIRIWARRGWCKTLPDYRTTHFLMRKILQKETVS
jgi:hypothetical protein